MKVTGNGSEGIGRGLNGVNDQVANSYSKLAAASRIAVAADDASGLSQSERLRAAIASLESADRNAADGISLAATAEGALDEVSESLGQMRELAVQSSNGTLSDADRASIQQEFDQLAQEVDRIASHTEFNGIALLDGSGSSVSLQTGTDAGDTIEVALPDASSAALGLEGTDVSTILGAFESLAQVDGAIGSVTSVRTSLGAAVHRLESSARAIDEAKERLTEAESRIRDVDVAIDTANLARGSILQMGAVSLLTQANVSSGTARELLGI